MASIERAFADRRPPEVLSDSVQLTEGEYREVMSFDGLDWRDVTIDLLEHAGDAVFWLSSEASCYYLPGMLTAGLKYQRSDLNAFEALIGTLDRSPNPDYWDEFFLARWTLLSALEIDAVSAWVKWLAVTEPDRVFENTYARVRDTLRLLKIRAGGA